MLVIPSVNHKDVDLQLREQCVHFRPNLRSRTSRFPVHRLMDSYLVGGLRSSRQPGSMTKSLSSSGIHTDLLPPSLVSCERAALERVENEATQAGTRHPSPQEIKVNNQDLTSCSRNLIIL